MMQNQLAEIPLSITKIRNNIWTIGIPSWLFGLGDRTVAAFADGYLTAIELAQLLMASFFFISWLYLKPEASFSSGSSELLAACESDALLPQHDVYLRRAQQRMTELQEHHLITQEYILPIPYICQIYHLLNLKHLETVHGFSLNNLKVVKIVNSEPTALGGKVRFQTVLESPYNVLRIWRQPIVEVELTLLTPYTVELNIPVYNDKRIVVIFNAIPLNNNEHKFFIDIYSNLGWPKLLIQPILHFAACLTLFEDLPYMQKLAERNLERVVKQGKVSNHESMWLFKRFADLYGNRLGNAQRALPSAEAA
ncbi:hypothetical protein H6F67_13680 [Microcoleus sp. FACHB-1515]|uniref:hypothetical protein n=1 Tax=Cyanophyceae TaxID=3028117 RepID=UPI001684D302|nr:hypothetical protein [Microcoleus sp. FACHB-1515]MBD2090902.1 hypothetical protein [Microcoleus sp. FACHB-1515]